MTLSGNVFFQEASDHYDRELPFVVYKYPNQSHIHGLLQSSDQLHKLDHMEQEGFVMVPFIGKAEAVIIPKIKVDFESGLRVAEIAKKHRISYNCAKKWSIKQVSNE